jgi:hypothetical protein
MLVEMYSCCRIILWQHLCLCVFECPALPCILWWYHAYKMLRKMKQVAVIFFFTSDSIL